MPSPVDRGKDGSKIHVISDANGIPLTTGVSAANTHDSVMLQPMVDQIPAVVIATWTASPHAAQAAGGQGLRLR